MPHSVRLELGLGAAGFEGTFFPRPLKHSKKMESKKWVLSHLFAVSWKTDWIRMSVEYL